MAGERPPCKPPCPNAARTFVPAEKPLGRSFPPNEMQKPHGRINPLLRKTPRKYLNAFQHTIKRREVFF